MPVIVLDHLTDAQKRAYILGDNRLALNAGWDDEMLAVELAALAEEQFDLNLLGFDDGELERLRSELDVPLVEENAAPEIEPTEVSQPGDEAVQELADLDRKIEQVDERLAQQLQPHTDLLLRLCSIPRVDFTTAAVILAEIGMDMSRFPDAGHFASWAGLSPGNKESAGKRYSGSTCKGQSVSAKNPDAKCRCASHADHRLAHYPGRHYL